MAFSHRSKTVLMYGAIFLIITAVVLIIAGLVGKPIVPTNKPTLSGEQKKNLLIDQNDKKKMVDDFNKKTGDTNALMQSETHYKYKFTPEFETRIRQIEQIRNSQSVKGISTLCNISEIPESVYVMDLHQNWLVNEAAAVAREYDVDSISYSMPSETTTFQYLFIRPDNTSSFSLYEGSGVYTYNRSSKLAAGTLTPDNLRRYASQILAAHQLDKNISPPRIIPRGEITQFIYRANLPDFVLVDSASIQSFFDGENCAVTESDLMGLTTVGVKNNGEITKLVNNTRTILNAYKMKTILPSEAQQQYADSQPLDPITFPAGVTPDPNATFSIDGAILAYVDVGLNFAQNLYMPMYVAHGFTRSDTGQEIQILTFFPAVSADDIAAKGLVREVPLPGNRSTQQQGTLPFATPTQSMPPPFTRKKPEIGVGGPGCPGGLVDYLVSCSDESNVICRGSFTGNASQDPMNACRDGCSAKTGVVDTAGGRNPCAAIMEQNGVTPEKINSDVPNQRVAPDGEVSCVITACPT